MNETKRVDAHNDTHLHTLRHAGATATMSTRVEDCREDMEREKQKTFKQKHTLHNHNHNGKQHQCTITGIITLFDIIVAKIYKKYKINN